MPDAYISAYEEHYKADSRDPSQAERLAIWKAAYGAIVAASQAPAAAQEAVAYRLEVQAAGVEPFTQYVTDRGFIATLRNAGLQVNATALYEAAPVAAAPVVSVDSDAFDYLVGEVAAEHGEMLDDGGPSGWSFSCEDLVAFAKHLMNDYKGVLVADAYAIARAEVKRDSTPAAPGIDLAVLRDIASDLSQSAKVDDYEPQQIAFIESIRDRLLALIDASPKGEQSGNSGELDSPKGGSTHSPGHNWCWECGRRPSDPLAFNCQARDFHMPATSAEVGA